MIRTSAVLAQGKDARVYRRELGAMGGQPPGALVCRPALEAQPPGVGLARRGEAAGILKFDQNNKERACAL